MTHANRQQRGLTQRGTRRVVIGGIVVVAGAAALALWRTSRHQPASNARAIAAPAGASTAAKSSDVRGMTMSPGGTVQLTTNEIRQFGITNPLDVLDRPQ